MLSATHRDSTCGVRVERRNDSSQTKPNEAKENRRILVALLSKQVRVDGLKPFEDRKVARQVLRRYL